MSAPLRAEVSAKGAEVRVSLRRGRRAVCGRVLKVLRADASGHELRVLYSGPGKAVPASCSPALMEAVARAAGALRSVEPESPLYWLAVLSGEAERTALETAFRESWPRAGRATPAKPAALYEALGAGLVEGFDASAGAVGGKAVVLTEFSEANLAAAAKEAYKAGFASGLDGLLNP